MEQYTNYCTEEQAKKAYELGAPIRTTRGTLDSGNHYYQHDGKLLEIPTTQQMIGWLREKGLYMSIHPVTDGSNYNWYFEMLFDFINDKENWHNGDMYIFTSFKEAELAAIDAALDYLEKGEKK